MPEAYPRTVIYLRSDAPTDGTVSWNNPILHEVRLDGPHDEEHWASIGAVDVSALFIKRGRFGRDETHPVDLTTRDGLAAALDFLRKVKDPPVAVAHILSRALPKE